jgi:hypothetical protein
MDNQYWASKQGDELITEIEKRARDYDEWYWTQRAEQLNASFRAFNGYLVGANQIRKGGEQGELSRISTNLYRTFLRQVETTVTSSKLNYEVSAINGDYDETQECIAAKNILSYYQDEKGVDGLNRDTLERALLYGEMFLTPRFNTELGEMAAMDPETGKPVTTGDLEFKLHNPTDVIRNFRSQSNASIKWWIIREKVGRYELAAKYPDQADKIISTSEHSQDMNRQYVWDIQSRLQEGDSQEDNEEVTIYTLYHEKSGIAGCEHGREVLICGDAVLEDGPLTYKHSPVVRLSVGDVDKTILGYSFMWDILPLQQAVDALQTALVTNNLNHSLQLIWSPTGDIQMNRLTEGCSVISSAQEPKPIQLVQSSPETYKLVEILQKFMGMVTGSNQVSQGQVPTGVSAASALALLSAEAVRFQSRVQDAYAQFCGQTGQKAIEALQAHAKEAAPIVYSIVGKDRRSAAASFSRADISSIRKVSVKLGSAIMGTVSGRVQIADNLLANKMVQNSQEYLTVIETGVLDRIDDSELMENQLIKSENERLQKGDGTIQALKTDRHIWHIQQHKAVLSDPDVRMNPQIVQATLDHIEMHEQLIPQVQSDAVMAQICGLPFVPPPPGPPPGPDQGPPPGPDQGPPPPMPGNGDPNQPNPANIPHGAPPELQDDLNQKAQFAPKNVAPPPQG